MELSDEVKKMMEDEPIDDGESSEKISEAFICCICLDLLYKPIVLACGHISCFWCVHRSMSGLRESHCPICRHPYHHFPSICPMLHFLLFKMYPAAYKRREIQILEYEKGKGSFSPQFDDPAFITETEKNLYHVGSPEESTISEYDLLSHPSSSGKDEILNVNPSESRSIVEENVTSNLQIATEDVESTIFVDEEKKLQQRITSRNCQQISVHDVLCTLCKELLFRPIVLNCGHAYCESCIVVPKNEMLRCQVCQITHPGKAPKVCLELDYFLEEQFPIEYAQRRTTVQPKQVHAQQESPITCSSEDATESFHFSPPSAENLLSWWGDHKVHIGAGCDCCGMYPIIGDRYKCKDCVERQRQSYDLCGECYATGSKLPGRFNQQHIPQHTFEIMRPNSIRNIMLRLLRGQLEEVSAAPNPSPDTTENPEYFYTTFSSDVQEATESDIPTANESENQDNRQ